MTAALLRKFAGCSLQKVGVMQNDAMVGETYVRPGGCTMIDSELGLGIRVELRMPIA